MASNTLHVIGEILCVYVCVCFMSHRSMCLKHLLHPAKTAQWSFPLFCLSYSLSACLVPSLVPVCGSVLSFMLPMSVSQALLRGRETANNSELASSLFGLLTYY